MWDQLTMAGASCVKEGSSFSYPLSMSGGVLAVMDAGLSEKHLLFYTKIIIKTYSFQENSNRRDTHCWSDKITHLSNDPIGALNIR